MVNCEAPHRVCFLSGGAASYCAARRVVEKHGTEKLVLLFTDTRTEDADLYRFLIEGAAHLTGRLTDEVRGLARRALSLPEPWDDEAARREGIASLQRDTREVVPELRWLADGRDLWQLARDERLVPNSRMDKCSQKLKRERGDRFVKGNFTPETAVLYFGIDHTEPARFLGDARRPGIRRLWEPWRVEAPLLDPPHLAKCDMLLEVERDGIDPPRLYDEGFPHNNCGGFCVKSGHAQFLALLKHKPQTFAYHAAKEQEMREYLGKDVSVMKDRRGGTLRPLPMLEFQRQVESGERTVNPRDWGKGCECFVGSGEGSDADEERSELLGPDLERG